MADERRARNDMVDLIAKRGVRDPNVLAAMRTVPRERFVEPELAAMAYADSALPIAAEQTISQPYIVALMIAAAEVRPGSRVLEVGAGSGYAAAVLGAMGAQVYAIERHPELVEAARRRLAALGYDRVDIRLGDGTLGLAEEAPFDAILVAAGGAAVPEPLKEQLAPGGRLVIPTGHGREQTLWKLVRRDGAFERFDLGPVMFVPLIGG